MQLELPNGKFVTVPDDISEEKKKELLETLSNSQEYQKIEETRMEDSAEQEGLIGDWRPEGAKTSWLFDNAVVAPYEASRKFINSTSSLAEGLGDTLGEKTNLGGFRYGKEAENGLMEYIPYDEAIKLGNVKGILSPITGNIGKKDYSHIKGIFYDPDKINPEDNTESLTASFVEGGVQFVLGWITGGKILKGAKIGTQVTFGTQLTKATAQGAIADFIGFDELSGRLTDMIVQYSPEMADTWLGYLQSDPNDTWWEARMKNTLEGAGIGAFADVLMAGLRLSKGYIGKNIDEKLLKHDEKIIEDAQKKIIEAKSLLEGATTISEKMKILSEIVEPAVKRPKLKITKAKQVILLNKITKLDLDVNFERYKRGEISAEDAFSIPHNFINIDVIDSRIVTKSFIQTIKAMHEAVYKNYDKVSKEFSDEVIKRRALQQYGGDLNKVYADFANLSKNTKNVSPLIYAHELMVHSLIKALPAFQRQVRMKVGTRTQKDVDDTLNYILAMMKNKNNYGSMTGGNFRTLGIVKKELIDNKVVTDNLEYAIREFEEFGKGADQIKAKQRLMEKLTTLDRASTSRLILDFVAQNRTWEVLNEIWINALLSSPKTQLVNAIGNGITAMARPIEDKLGANISAFLSADDIGRVTKYNAMSKEAGSTFAGLFRHMREALRIGGQAFRRGELILEGSEGMSKIDTGTNKATGTGVFGQTVRLPSRALNAGDEVFKQVNYRSKLEAIAVREAHIGNLKGKEFDEFVDRYFKDGFDEHGRGLNPEALEYARVATYTNELTGFAKKFQQAVNEYPFLKQIFPFIRTPFQLAKSVVDRSPVALTYRLKHILGETNNPQMIAKARGQLAMGSMLFSSAFIFSKMGWLSSATNQTSDDGRILDKYKDAELMRFKKSELNFKPYSFIINGVQIPFGRLDPYGAFFGLVADISTNYQRLTQEEIERLGADMQLFLLNQSENNPLSIMDKAGIATKATFRATRDNLLSKTYLQTVHEIVNALFDKDERAVKRYFSTKLGSFYPNILYKIVNDPYLRDATDFIDQLKKRTGLGVVEPKFNFMGFAHKNPEGGFERLFNNMLSPVTATKLRESVIATEILRLGKAPPNLKKFQNNVDYTEYKYKGKSAYYRLNYLLSTVEIEDMTFEEKLKDLFATEEYKSLTDPLKIHKTIADDGAKYRRIKALYSKYLTEAEAQFRKEWILFKHEDDNKRNLSEDITKQDINQKAVTQENRTDKSLIEALQILRNY